MIADGIKPRRRPVTASRFSAAGGAKQSRFSPNKPHTKPSLHAAGSQNIAVFEGICKKWGGGRIAIIAENFLFDIYCRRIKSKMTI
jgi:hypothetical protein